MLQNARYVLGRSYLPKHILCDTGIYLNKAIKALSCRHSMRYNTTHMNNAEQLKKLNEVGRKFSDNMFINHNREVFLLGIISGNEAENYVVSPSHAKGILTALAKHIDMYEKQFGTIDTSPAPLLSPIQGSDLNK